jgi:hypothetical protein
MSIELDDKTFGRLLDIAMPGRTPPPTETSTILQIAQLAAGVDLDEDLDERGLLGTLTQKLCATAGIPLETVTPLSPLPIHTEERTAQIATLADGLVTSSSRELAYIVAYLLIVSDLELAPVETELLDGLRGALRIEGRRASELAAEVSELVTPGAPGEPESAPAPP